MRPFAFWKNWPIPYQLLFGVCALAAFAGMGYYLFAFFERDQTVIFWLKEGEVSGVPMVLDRFYQYLFEFTVDTQSYLITEKFVASDIAIAPEAYLVYLALVVLGSLLLLVAMSDLTPIWMLVLSAFLFLFWGTMDLGALGVFPDLPADSLLVAVIFAYFGPVLAFFFWWKDANYLLRFLVYASVTAAVYYLIDEQAVVPHPWQHLATHSFAVPMILSILFIFLNGHEYIRAFVFITTHPSLADHNAFRKFLFLSLVYMANMVYVYLFYTRQIDLETFHLHPLLIFVGSTLLGLWGFQARSPQYEGIFRFDPTGAFLYMGLALIAVGSVLFSLLTLNDSLREVYEDAIMYSHLGMGLGFMAYIYFNFKEMMEAGKPVYRILYRTMQFDYLYVPSLALFCLFALLLNSNFFTYQQMFGAYYNAAADLYLANGDTYNAKQYYNLATGYDTKNHRSFYALGNLAEMEGDPAAASYFYNEALTKNPTPYAYQRIARILENEQRFFEALFSYQNALKKFPESGELYNNLALLFNRTNLADSVFLYFQLAEQYSQFPEVIQGNQFSLWTKYQIYTSLDSVYSQGIPADYLVTQANELAFLNTNNQPAVSPFAPEKVADSVLNTPQLNYLFNYALNQRHNADTALIRLLETKMIHPGNAQFQPFLAFALANLYYYKGQLSKALPIMQALQQDASFNNPDYAHHLGLWFMQMGEHQEAARYFEIAAQRGQPNDRVNQAIALSEGTDRQAALTAWQEIAQKGQPHEQPLAHDMLRLLSPDSLKVLALEDPQTDQMLKYRYLHYHMDDLTDERFSQLLPYIPDVAVRIVAITERVHWALDRRNIPLAVAYMQQMINRPEVSDEVLRHIQQAEFRLADARQVYPEGFAKAVEEATFPTASKYRKGYYLGNYYQSQGDFERALTYWKIAIAQNPYREEVFVAPVDFLVQSNRREEAYDLLVEALRVNPNSIGIRKMYCLLCLEMGYDAFAETSLETLFQIMPPTPYQDFLRVYNAKKAEVEKQLQDW